jgi:hypothetical protein
MIETTGTLTKVCEFSRRDDQITILVDGKRGIKPATITLPKSEKVKPKKITLE